MNSVRILVLGDMGCSPRMRNHCLSFAQSGWKVYFSGYLQSELPNNILNNDLISIDPVKESPPFINQRKERKLFLFLKVLFTSFYLFFFLLNGDWTNILVIQNPPAVPTFVIVWLIAKLRGIKVIIDWHNYGYSLMDRNAEKRSLFSRLYKRVEVKFSRKRLKAKNFCVSKAFVHDLLLKWDIKAEVLYDLPWKINAERNTSSIHELILKLGKNYPVLLGDGVANDRTAITERTEQGDLRYRIDRPAVVVSSCSWTIDDDFETLFKALNQYNTSVSNGHNLPSILCVITGRGPMKRYFERIVAEQEWAHVSVIMPWLEIEDYPVLLSAADVGICLHNSTSGLDLPMKIIDMFSVGLPVLALNYKCLHELVIDRFNGRLFGSPESLHGHLIEMLARDARGTIDTAQLDQYRRNITENSGQLFWQEHWEQTVLPVATQLASH